MRPSISSFIPIHSHSHVLLYRTHASPRRLCPALPLSRTPPKASVRPPTPPQSSPPSEPTSLLILNLLTILWGTQHSLIKATVSADTLPATLNSARFLLAALISLPFLPRLTPRSPLLRPALEQSLWMFLGYAAQTLALQTTPASRSAFLLYLLSLIHI